MVDMTHRRANRVAMGVLGATALGLWSAPAAASNGTKPRIPVDWSGAPCMTIVDRSASAMLHLPYAVTEEDVGTSADEVEDSRTHQFFALCRARDPQTFLPRWITQADIERAQAVGAAPDMVDPEDVFESSTAWQRAGGPAWSRSSTTRIRPRAGRRWRSTTPRK
jgi:hypothetical protein